MSLLSATTLANPVVQSAVQDAAMQVLSLGGKKALDFYRTSRSSKYSKPSVKGRKRKYSDRTADLGDAVGTGTSKMRGLQRTYTTQNNRTLESVGLLNLTKGSGIDDRERNMVNFRGCKICFEVENTFNTLVGRKLYFNVAVITPKALSDTTTSIPTAGFFRNSGALDRSIAFSNSLSSLEFHCLPINTDKYHVMKHERKVLGPYSSTEGVNTLSMDFYVKVNRQIRYLDTGSAPVGKNLWLVYWVDYFGAVAGSTPVNCGRIGYDITQFFKEPKN